MAVDVGRRQEQVVRSGKTTRKHAQHGGQLAAIFPGALAVKNRIMAKLGFGICGGFPM